MTASERTPVSTLILLAVLACLLIAPLSGCAGSGGDKKGPSPETAGTSDEKAEEAVPLVPAKTGDRVAAPWGGDMYIGSVQAVRGDQADVLYDDDQVVREVPISQLVVVTVKEWKVGDRVNAVWTTGRFYPGVVTAVKDGGVYTVKWDDGDTPSDVEAAKIYAGEVEE